MKVFFVLFLAFILNGQVLAEGLPNQNDRSSRELSMAENAIFSSLLVASSRNGRYLCSQTPLACIGPNGAELGLALVASKNSDASLKSLASILRYRIDAAISEDYSCYTLEKGKLMAAALRDLKADQLAMKCKDELIHAKTVHKELFGDVDSQAVCAEQTAISERAKSLIDAIESGRKCDNGDF